jgi:hypothetical protein
MKSKIAILFFTSLFFFSCSNDSTSDLIIIDSQNSVVKYSSQVKNIIDSNCINCHGTTPINGASIPLVTYQNVKDATLNLGLIDRISKAQGDPGLMPNNGTRLPQASIDIIVKWKNEGFLE